MFGRPPDTLASAVATAGFGHWTTQGCLAVPVGTTPPSGLANPSQQPDNLLAKPGVVGTAPGRRFLEVEELPLRLVVHDRNLSGCPVFRRRFGSDRVQNRLICGFR